MAPPDQVEVRLERLEGTLLELVTALGMLVSELSMRDDLALDTAGEVEQALERGWKALVAEAEAAGADVVSLDDVRFALAGLAGVEKLAGDILRQAMSVTGAAVGAVYAVPEHDTALVLVASAGYPDEVMSQFRILPLDAPLPATRVAREGRPVWFRQRAEILDEYPDLETAHKRTEEALGSEGVQGGVVPLEVDGRVVAVLIVGFTETGSVERLNSGLLQELASRSGLALARSSLRREVSLGRVPDGRRDTA